MTTEKTREGGDYGLGGQLLKPEEAAERLSVSRSTLFLLMDSGELPSLKIRRARRVPAAAIEHFVAARLAEQR